MRTITLGYTFLTEKMPTLEKFRLYVTASNLFILTGYSGYDPETSDSLNPDSFGIDTSSPPALRTFTAGFNLIF